MAIISAIIEAVKGVGNNDSLCAVVENDGRTKGNDLYSAVQARNEPRNCPAPPGGYAGIDTYTE
jgi:hypothetical protein